METEGVIFEIPGREGVICVKTRDQGDQQEKQKATSLRVIYGNGKDDVNEILVIDVKRRRVDKDKLNENQETVCGEGSVFTGPKNGLEVDPGIQARLRQ